MDTNPWLAMKQKKTFIQCESPKRQRLWIKVFFNRLPIVIRDILKGIMTKWSFKIIYLKLQRKKVINYLNELTRMKAFYYGGCVNQIPATQHACQIRIQLLNRHPGIFQHGVDWKKKKTQIPKNVNETEYPPIILAIQTKLIGLMIMDESDSVHKGW